MRRGLLRALVVYRWAALIWMAAVAGTLYAAGRMVRPGLALALTGAATAVTIATTVMALRRPDLLESPVTVAVEVACGFAVVIGDGWVYPAGHAFSLEQNLGVGWPLAGILAAGAVLGAWAGGACGIAYGIARIVAVLVNGGRPGSGTQWVALASVGVMFGAAGATSGIVVTQIERIQREVSAARAREDVARTLHDGVLQTLAVIERRTDDPELAALARSTERDLRTFLLTPGTATDQPDPDGDPTRRRTAPADLTTRLHAAANRYEATYSGSVDIVIAADCTPPPADIADALVGAVGEALTNAGKHGDATRITVYLEPDERWDGDGWFCSVNDNGNGFDPATATERIGLRSSVRGRIDDVGGHVEIDTRPGGGCEIRMHIPPPARRR